VLLDLLEIVELDVYASSNLEEEGWSQDRQGSDGFLGLWILELLKNGLLKV